MPFQLAAGLYMAIMLVFVTIAILVRFDDGADQCDDLEVLIHPEPAAIFEMPRIWNS